MDKVAHPEPEEPVFKAEPMTIRVDDPQKSSSGSFITYRLFTMVWSIPQFIFILLIM